MWPFKKPKPSAEEVYNGLRAIPFGAQNRELAQYVKPGQPYGVVVEIGMLGTTVTLVAFVDGTTSMYVKGGPAYIGGEGRKEVRDAGIRLIAGGLNALSLMPLDPGNPLPAQDHVRFHVFTPEGKHCVDSEISKLRDGVHPFSKFYLAAQNLITQFRLIDERENKR